MRAPIETFSCQSGSNGNCIFVRAGRTRLLIDAGISGRRAELRMAHHGQDIRKVDALLLSHDHHDHARCGGVYQRKFGLPIHTTGGTYRACRGTLGRVDDVRLFDPGETFEIGEAVIHTISTPHDGAEGVCFIICHAGRRLGVFTDLGFVFGKLAEAVADVDAMYLESNYDPEMLQAGPYPPHLQARIRGDGGHLANAEAAALLRDFGTGRVQWAALAHLSEQNNTPAAALHTARRVLRRPMQLHVARRTGVSQVFRVL